MKFAALLAVLVVAVNSASIPSREVNVNYQNFKKTYESLGYKIPKSVEEDALLTAPELIRKYGYPCEVYDVTTDDGYILEVHRIPYGIAGPSANRPVVFVQHGLLSSSSDWVIIGTEKGLGYKLADAGYDVWMGNARGNRYSRRHVSLDPDLDADAFWNFSWNEIAYYDISAMIDFTLATTGQPSLYHIGHSQGTTTFYILMSERPEYNAKIRAHHSLAPIAYMGHLFSPLVQTAAFFDGTIEILLAMIGINEFLPNSDFLAYVGSALCGDTSFTQALCTNSLFAICGFNEAQMNATILPVLMGHTPAGSSTKQFLHYTQETASGYFRKYDFGLFGNLDKYGQMYPPDYDLSKVTAAVYLHWGPNDWLSAQVDVEQLNSELGNSKGLFSVPDPNFNHLDFMYAVNVDTLIYNTVISLLPNN